MKEALLSQHDKSHTWARVLNIIFINKVKEPGCAALLQDDSWFRGGCAQPDAGPGAKYGLRKTGTMQQSGIFFSTRCFNCRMPTIRQTNDVKD